MDYESAREEMVKRQLRGRRITDERVLDVMGRIPREEFIPWHSRFLAYSDEPVGIGWGQTISQPYITALMAQSLELNGTENVLEVGAGSGYHAAVLGRLAHKVVAIEIIPELAGQAAENLKRTQLEGNVIIVCADGSLGYSYEAPFDAISVAAAAPEIPPALLDQLADPGRLVIPVGTQTDQDLLLVEKRAGELMQKRITLCRFVPLRGTGGWRD